MFSAARLDRCEAAVTVRDGAAGRTRALPLPSMLQRGFLSLLERGQPRVVDRVLARACEGEGAVSATLTRRCRGADGAELAPEEIVRACRASP
jgi:hypothetical protein